MQVRSVVMLCGVIAAAPLHAQNIPGVDVWIAAPTDSVAPGDRILAYAAADPEAYMVVFRVTVGNHIVVIVPRTPYGGYRVPSRGLQSKGVDVSFPTDTADSMGHLFAAASYTPFDFSRVRAKKKWDQTRLVAPATLAPIDAADWFLRHIVPSQQTAYSVNEVAYYVGISPPPVVGEPDQGGGYGGGVGVSPSQSTVIYVTPEGDGASYFSSEYPWSVLPVVPWYGSGYYWYDPYAHHHFPYRQLCPDGSVVPRNVPCPLGGVIGVPSGAAIGSGRTRPVPHRSYPLRTVPSQPRGRMFPPPNFRHTTPTTIIPTAPMVGRPTAPARAPQHGVQGVFPRMPRVVPAPSVARPAPQGAHIAPPVVRPALPAAPSTRRTTQ